MKKPSYSYNPERVSVEPNVTRSDSVTVKEKTLLSDASVFPSVEEVFFKGENCGVTINSPHSARGICMNCARDDVVYQKVRERKHIGTANVKCAWCGAFGSVTYFIRNQTTDSRLGWESDRSNWDEPPKYRVFRSHNRGFRPGWATNSGADDVEITSDVPYKRINSVINLDHRPKVWRPDDSIGAGVFLSNKAIENRSYGPVPEKMNWETSQFHSQSTDIQAPIDRTHN